jgi:hypothetical protein
MGYAVPDQALADTSQWLAQPGKWDKNGGEGPFSDKVLARIQFAAALAEAIDAGRVRDRQALAKAAELVAEHQQQAGFWKVDPEGTVGAPATHGTALATYFARRTLQRADARRYEAAIARADQWFRALQSKNTPDAAALLLALPSPAPGSPGLAEDAIAQQKQCLDLLRRGQSRDGGWGPYATSPPEPFDTAVALLALTLHGDQPGVKAMLRRGRAYLISAQLPDGSWPETTRPPGAESYAQRISTAGWATLALLATREQK